MKNHKWFKVFVGLPAILVSIIPVITCPLCWTTYAALLSAMGLSFFDYTPLLLPLISICVLFALVVFLINFRKSGNYWPLIIGIFSGIAVIFGKFVVLSPVMVGAGIVGLAVSSTINFFASSNSNKACNLCKGTSKKEKNKHRRKKNKLR